MLAVGLLCVSLSAKSPEFGRMIANLRRLINCATCSMQRTCTYQLSCQVASRTVSSASQLFLPCFLFDYKRYDRSQTVQLNRHRKVCGTNVIIIIDRFRSGKRIRTIQSWKRPFVCCRLASIEANWLHLQCNCPLCLESRKHWMAWKIVHMNKKVSVLFSANW